MIELFCVAVVSCMSCVFASSTTENENYNRIVKSNSTIHPYRVMTRII